jgi:hypothetical protein
VAARVDQMVPMMYDTTVKFQKFYTHLMASWTTEVLDWSGRTQVLLGLPAYAAAGAAYPDPRRENLENVLRGVHGGLKRYKELPANCAGVALYCEWEMEPQKWDAFQKAFEK